mgnify:CR=1 FL=1
MTICKLNLYRSGWALCRKVDVQGSLVDDDKYHRKRYDDAAQAWRWADARQKLKLYRCTVTVDVQMKLVNNNKEAKRDMGSCV